MNAGTVTKVTHNEMTLVTSGTDVSGCITDDYPDVTGVTDVTAQNEERELELKAQMVSTGHMADGAEMEMNSSDVYRFADPDDSNGKKTGWCTPFYDEEGRLCKAVYGSYHYDGTHYWEHSGYSSLPSEQQELIRQQMAERQQQLRSEREQEQQANRVQLQARLERSTPLTEHPYLSTKGVKAYGLLQGMNEELIIPFYDGDGRLVTAQRVKPRGEKLLWAGCGKKGGFHKIAGDSRTILIAEGYATAASLFEATGYTSIMAIDAGNLEPVAKTIKTTYPDSVIVICCDNDQFSSTNTGVEKGQKAAKSIGAEYVIPHFSNTDSKPTDFNDLHQLEGEEAIRQQVLPIIEKAMLRIPEGFSIKEDGVYREIPKKDGEFYDAWISSPLKVTALTRDTSSQSWGRLIELVDKDNHIHSFAMPMELLTGSSSEFLTPLVDKGLTYSVDNKRHLHQYLSAANPVNRARCVNKTGWFDRVFVLPQEVIGETAETIIFQSVSGHPRGFEEAGTLAEWRENVSVLCEGNSRLLFGISTAFATAMLDMLDGESGGFHFRCGSSRGKTTILMLAKSVWGSPDGLPRWRATANGLEGLAALHNHSLLCLDEFSQLAEVNPKTAGEAVYMLGNGEGKQRSRKDGKMADRQRWQLLYLSAGEVSLRATLEQAGLSVRAGQEVRFIDLPADAGAGLGAFDTVQDYQDGNWFAMAIKENSLKYHGSAARAFIRELAANRERYQEEAVNQINAFTQSLRIDEADPQVKRVAQRFATVAASGEMATAMGITGWTEGQANWAATVCFQAWLEERGGSDSHEETQAIELVKGRLLEWGDARFIDLCGCQLNGAVWGHKGSDGFYVFPKAFKDHICSGLDPKYVASVLAERGFLTIGTDGRHAVPKRLGGKVVRLYHIKSELLNDGEAETVTPEAEAVSSLAGGLTP